MDKDAVFLDFDGIDCGRGLNSSSQRQRRDGRQGQRDALFDQSFHCDALSLILSVLYVDDLFMCARTLSAVDTVPHFGEIDAAIQEKIPNYILMDEW